MISAIHGYLDIIKYIVEKSEDIQSEYNNALRYSAKYGHLNVVKYLIIDCNMIVKQKTLKSLEKEQYLDVVKLISIRDLNKKLNNNLSSNINTMNKIHKVKI
jgi:ankyrin repeat protein